MIIDILLQAGCSFLIGFMTRFKWLIFPFIGLYFIALGFILYTEPASGLLEGFALWRWFITIPTWIFGYWLGGLIKK